MLIGIAGCTETKSAKAWYKTTNWRAYNVALKAKGSLTIWLNKDMPWYAVASVSADGAYDTKACHAAIAQRGTQAVIPPRKNGRPWKASLAGATIRNEALKSCRALGWSIWTVWSGYHRRSLMETKMHCFKRLRERVMARTFERQVVEQHVRVSLLNHFTQLGRPAKVLVGAVALLRSGQGAFRSQLDLCNKAFSNRKRPCS